MSAEIGVGIGDQWAVGFLGSFAQERWLGEGYDGTSYGLWGTHFFSGYGDDSLYLKGVFEAGHMDMSKRAADVDGKNIRGAISYNQGKLLLGYRWIRDNGVSLSLGGGFNYVAAESNFDEGRVMRIGNLKAKVPNGTTRGFVPNIEFALGVQI